MASSGGLDQPMIWGPLQSLPIKAQEEPQQAEGSRLHTQNALKTRQIQSQQPRRSLLEQS